MKVRICMPIEFEVEGDNIVDVAYNWWDLKRKITHYGYENAYVEEEDGDIITEEFLQAFQYASEEDDNSVKGFKKWLKKQ